MSLSYSFGNVSLPSSPEESSPVGHSPPMIFPVMTNFPANLQGLMDLGMQLAAHAQQIRLPDFEDNRESDGASPASSVEEVPVHLQSKTDDRYPKKVCRICRIEEATVSHFGVDVCTGCRAFFRRSVGQQKTYRCLNGKLCGRDTLVPNRRVCKYCRFQRCIEAGMLKSKERMYAQKLDHVANDSMETSLSPSEAIVSSREFMGPTDTNTVLEQFVLYRRKIAYERLHTHYQSGQKTIGETDVMHHVELGLRETQMLNRILSGAHPYDTISHEDRNTLFAEYSLCWTIEENVFSTIRNGGHISRRMHHVDGSYIQLNEDGAFRHWSGLYPMITGDDRDAVFNALVRFFFAAALHLTSHVTREVAKANLSEEENAALMLLFFCRHEVVAMVDESARESLINLRQQTLRSLSNYIRSTGQCVEERLAQIVFLISALQGSRAILKQCVTLLRAATMNNVLPADYTNQLDDAERSISCLKLKTEDNESLGPTPPLPFLTEVA